MFFYGIVAVRHCMTMTILSWWSDSDDLHGLHWSVNLLMTSHGLVIAGQQVMRKLMELFGAQIYDPWPFPNSLTSYGRHIRSNYVLGKSLFFLQACCARHPDLSLLISCLYGGWFLSLSRSLTSLCVCVQCMPVYRERINFPAVLSGPITFLNSPFKELARQALCAMSWSGDFLCFHWIINGILILHARFYSQIHFWFWLD